ncbi:ABC transporter substrate-binding protein, partial [Thermodesulfobacteriota bacterium]
RRIVMKLKRYFLVFVLSTVLLGIPGITLSAQKRPTTVAELALYKGADRQQILEEGAKKEGKLIFYTVQTLKQPVRPLVNAYQKKYPYIKVEIWRGGSKLVPRLAEEYKSGRHVVDVITVSQHHRMVLEERGILQPFYSPELAYIEEDVIKKAPGGGVFSAGHSINGRGLGYNTELITKDQLPKSYQDLLDPKWKGKLAIAGGNAGINWIGNLLITYGEEFVRQIAKQNLDVHMASARAILDMVIAGEYPFSPTIAESHATFSKKLGAPVGWVPLEPAHCNLNQIVLPKHSAHPHAALLYIDLDLSKEAGAIYKTSGDRPTRKDVVNPKPYKTYFGPESTKQVMKWTKLFGELFLKK